MTKYKVLLFDLDGTLTDSEEGILNCVRYGLESCGFPVPEYEVLRAFIGPPLMYSCTHFCGLSKADSESVILKYRERYSEKGIYENRLYDGIKELLSDLKKAGYKIALATSKPEVFALRILEHFDIAEYFDAAAGSTCRSWQSVDGTAIQRPVRRYAARSVEECCRTGEI